MLQDMGFLRGGEIRLGGERRDIRLAPETPFWFVPSLDAQRLMKTAGPGMDREAWVRAWKHLSGRSFEAAALDVEHLVASLSTPPADPYRGRGGCGLERLSEVWFHLTDACNLACRHCLFRDGGARHRSLAPEAVTGAVREAHALGCRLVCFTGGEPFVYPDFPGLVERLLEFSDLRVAVLTNGLLAPGALSRLQGLDRDRLHFQISLDGPEAVHDRFRGVGTFDKTTKALRALLDYGMACGVAMAVNPETAGHMAEVVRIASGLGVGTVHLQWHLDRGAGAGMGVPEMTGLFASLGEAVEAARRAGVLIDNLEAVRAQVFSPAGTRFDLGNAAWESLAVGPDGVIYPTPAMVDRPECASGRLEDGLEAVWRSSPVLERIRGLSLLDVEAMAEDPWRFLLGGGDLDHALCAEGSEPGAFGLREDPYAPVYQEMARLLIEEAAGNLPEPGRPGVVLRMGDATTACPSGAGVNFTHCNCLLSLGEGDARGLVREFYAERAATVDESIRNPVTYGAEKVGFIPGEALVRMYGCGSPVDDAMVKPAEVVVDLGCGTGVECFLAARAVGPKGRAIGVDMTDAMLEIARRAQTEVAGALGYANTEFLKGYLEEIPLEDGVADVVVSNCVVNLSKNKRRVFAEIRRILKPGGRLVISDVVTETEPALAIRADHQLRGECIGGAFEERYLFALLGDMGFSGGRVVKRFPYRTVGGHSFYSLTFTAHRPAEGESLSGGGPVLYAGPFEAVIAEDGTVLQRGRRMRWAPPAGVDGEALSDMGVLTLDEKTGAVTNRAGASSCACFTAPAAEAPSCCAPVPETGCLVCGQPLVYQQVPQRRVCAKCGGSFQANAVCREGHFVCDLCHVKDPIEIIRRRCLASEETDMIALLRKIRRHAAFPLHGPEHHALVPGVILAVYRNLGGEVSEEQIRTGIERGGLVPGGTCGFWGACGAAVGVGIAFSILLDGTPLRPGPRQAAQNLVADILRAMAEIKAARCCQRESVVALRAAAAASEGLLPVRLQAGASLVCEQFGSNRECVRRACPLYPGQAASPEKMVKLSPLSIIKEWQ